MLINQTFVSKDAVAFVTATFDKFHILNFIRHLLPIILLSCDLLKEGEGYYREILSPKL